jgi:hypothetical protein
MGRVLGFAQQVEPARQFVGLPENSGRAPDNPLRGRFD